MKDIPAMWDYKTGKWIIRFTNPVTGEVEEAIDEQAMRTNPTPIDTDCSMAMLREAADTIENRAALRDVEKEKTMRDTINAFNAMYHTELTEEQGWMFMVLLKMRRARGGGYNRDDYVDGAAYFALAAEGAIDDKKS